MKHVGVIAKERYDRVVFENELMKGGFAAFPYRIMKNKTLSIGSRLTYAFLLMYGWQEGSSHTRQKKMAETMGVSGRQMQRYLYELRDDGLIRIERHDKRYHNTYVILDKKPTKLKRKKHTKTELDTTPMSYRTRHP